MAFQSFSHTSLFFPQLLNLQPFWPSTEAITFSLSAASRGQLSMECHGLLPVSLPVTLDQEGGVGLHPSMWRLDSSTLLTTCTLSSLISRGIARPLRLHSSRTGVPAHPPFTHLSSSRNWQLIWTSDCSQTTCLRTK